MMGLRIFVLIGERIEQAFAQIDQTRVRTVLVSERCGVAGRRARFVDGALINLLRLGRLLQIRIGVAHCRERFGRHLGILRNGFEHGDGVFHPPARRVRNGTVAGKRCAHLRVVRCIRHALVEICGMTNGCIERIEAVRAAHRANLGTAAAHFLPDRQFLDLREVDWREHIGALFGFFERAIRTAARCKTKDLMAQVFTGFRTVARGGQLHLRCNGCVWVRGLRRAAWLRWLSLLRLLYRHGCHRWLGRWRRSGSRRWHRRQRCRRRWRLSNRLDQRGWHIARKRGHRNTSSIAHGVLRHVRRRRDRVNRATRNIGHHGVCNRIAVRGGVGERDHENYGLFSVGFLRETIPAFEHSIG
ncbi:hypothetical protein [Paraburkholderia sp. J63]|uniref:hypothetical protein n=1 Tax=Paraburkholderia sp. J63 TaxID=2805434 RepID=UPI0039F4BEBE